MIIKNKTNKIINLCGIKLEPGENEIDVSALNKSRQEGFLLEQNNALKTLIADKKIAVN